MTKPKMGDYLPNNCADIFAGLTIIFLAIFLIALIIQMIIAMCTYKNRKALLITLTITIALTFALLLQAGVISLPTNKLV